MSPTAHLVRAASRDIWGRVWLCFGGISRRAGCVASPVLSPSESSLGGGAAAAQPAPKASVPQYPLNEDGTRCGVKPRPHLAAVSLHCTGPSWSEAGAARALHGAARHAHACRGVAQSPVRAAALAEVLHGAVEMCTATCKGVAWSYVSMHEYSMKLYECACLHGHCMDLCGCACLRGCCLEPCECACLHAWILQEAECARLHACSIDIARSSVCALILCCSAGVRACPGTMHSLHGHRAAPDLGFGHQNCPQDHVATVGATTATGQR